MESESQRNESLSISELREGRGQSAGLSSVFLTARRSASVALWVLLCLASGHI